MKANPLRIPPFFHGARQRAADVDPVFPLAEVYADLSTARHRLSLVIAEYRRACTAAPIRARVAWARMRLVHGVVVEGCRALDRVAELPALVRPLAGPAGRFGDDLEAQADAVASAAARLAVLLRSQGTGFRGDPAGFRGDLPAPGLARLAGLGPNETDASLILAAENVSRTLSLAASVVLVLARLRAPRRRARRLAVFVRACPAGWAARWVVRAATLPLAAHLLQRSPVAPIPSAAVVVGTVLAALVALASRRVPVRLPGPVRTALDLLGDLADVAVAVALPHAVLLALALVDLTTDTWTTAHPHRRAGRGEPGCVGFTPHRPRPRRTRREHRDR